MKNPARHTDPDDGQMLFSYRRTFAERLASQDLRDVSNLAKLAGFQWRLAATKRLFCDVEAVPSAHGRTESVRRRWQHLFLLASPVAAHLRKDGTKEKEIKVVLRTTDAPERSREHIKSLVLRRETTGDENADSAFTLGYRGE